jgi:Rod binding domain-containing protein
MPETPHGIPSILPQNRFLELTSQSMKGRADVRKLRGPTEGRMGQSDDAARLRKAAKDFEAVFLYQVLKQMRNTINKEEMFHGGTGEDLFSDMMDEEIAKTMAGRGSTGIGEAIYRQLCRRYGIEEGKPKGAGADSSDKGTPATADDLQRRLRAVLGEVKAPSTRGLRRGF